MCGVSLPKWFGAPFRWFFREFSRDMRAAIYSVLVVGFVGLLAWLGGVFAKDPPKLTKMNVNALGMATPSHLYDDVIMEGIGTITFDSNALKKAYVCDYYFDRGETFWSLALDYLDTYQSCFRVSATSDTDIFVHPVKNSGNLVKENGNYYCQCSEETIKRHLAN